MSVIFKLFEAQDTIHLLLICLQLDFLGNIIPFTLRLIISLLGEISECQELYTSIQKKKKKKKKSMYFSIHDVHGFQNLDLCSINRLASNKIKFESYCYYYCLKRKGRGKEAFSKI